VVFREFLTSLYVADLPAALRFYRDLLGAEETFRYPAEGEPLHVEVRLGPTTLALSSYEAVLGYGLPPATPGTPFELAVRVSDVDAAFAALRDAGTPVLREPWVAPNGQRVAYLTDPDGNRVHLWA
jgi:lactoylglutathione lyase